jgi:hypothetical protein
MGIVAIPVLVVGPNVIASRYTDGPGGADIRATRPDDGWRFIYDAVRLSRGAKLGSEDGALERAREIWASQPAAESVELVYQETRPFDVPVPPSGVRPLPGTARAQPLSPLGWVVTGRFGAREPQMIGLLDMHSGQVAWRIRRTRGRR